MDKLKLWAPTTGFWAYLVEAESIRTTTLDDDKSISPKTNGWNRKKTTFSRRDM